LRTLLQLHSPNGLIRRLEVELPPGATLQELLTGEGIIVDLENYLLVVNSRATSSAEREPWRTTP
jgi:hypothetical protein